MLLRYHRIRDRRVRSGCSGRDERSRERLVVEEDPGVAVFVVPAGLELLHGLEHAVELGVADEGYECGFGAGAVGEEGEEAGLDGVSRTQGLE